MSLIIGIDPDIDKSGCSIYNKETKELKFMAIKFFDLHRWMIEHKSEIGTVKIEGGWLNKKSNFRENYSKKVSDRISKNVGENHAVGKKIVEMCEDLDINYNIVKPLLKKWKGKDGKITHEEIVKLLQPINILVPNKTNQDVRDSILICLF